MTEKVKAGVEEANDVKPLKQSHSVKLGIWELIFHEKPKHKGRRSFLMYIQPYVTSIQEAFATRWLIVRMFKDAYTLAPLHLIIYIFFHLCNSLQDTVFLYINSQVTMEVCFPNPV